MTPGVACAILDQALLQRAAQPVVNVGANESDAASSPQGALPTQAQMQRAAQPNVSASANVSNATSSPQGTSLVQGQEAAAVAHHLSAVHQTLTRTKTKLLASTSLLLVVALIVGVFGFGIVVVALATPRLRSADPRRCEPMGQSKVVLPPRTPPTPALTPAASVPASMRVIRQPLTDHLVIDGASRPPSLLGDSSYLHLCPELVVPEASECVLLVPQLSAFDAIDVSSVFVINDARGVPVFDASFAPDVQPSSAAEPGFRRRLLLSSTTQGDDFDSAVFAYLREPPGRMRSGKAPHELQVCHFSDTVFGQLAPHSQGGRGSYSVTTALGRRTIFSPGQPPAIMHAADERGRLLAVVKSVKGETRYSVTIGPMVDAGLVVLSLMGIDWLATGDQW